MNAISRFMIAGAALALAGCSALPGANLGGTFTAESYLGASIEGGDFNSALAREYQALAARSATKEVNWMDATAYVAKSQQAAMGGADPWTDAELGVVAQAGLYDELVSTVAAHRAARPAECAKAQAMWDQYLESLTATSGACLNTDDALAMLQEALAACRGVSGDFVVYFGFDRSDLTAAGRQVIEQVVEALKSYSAPLVSVVGHTDTVGSVAYNQRLSERRANTVANAILARAKAEGLTPPTITTAGRSELELAVPTPDNVREPRNRRATIAISQ
ncbi:MAG: OmpA family protein [Alphaproteobacteria bacterium]|nr:MAG: OmpA family protein [Alphaproteobacteria bacterium]